jgi:hypothetical protein
MCTFFGEKSEGVGRQLGILIGRFEVKKRGKSSSGRCYCLPSNNDFQQTCSCHSLICIQFSFALSVYLLKFTTAAIIRGKTVVMKNGSVVKASGFQICKFPVRSLPSILRFGAHNLLKLRASISSFQFLRI